MKKYGLLFIFIILVFMVSEAVASRTHMNFKLKYLNNKLSVNVEKVALGSVLAKIQEKTGIKFQLDKEASGRIISVGFQPLPIEKAIQRILNQLNYAIIFSSDGKASKVIVIGTNKKSFCVSNTIIIEPTHRDGMVITHPPDGMVITHPPDGMVITHPPDGMVITHPPDGMVITHPPDGMVITHPPDGMVITHPPDGMVIEPGGEGMKVTNDGAEMKITHDGDEMKITHPSDKMKIAHSSDPNPR